MCPHDIAALTAKGVRLNPTPAELASVAALVLAVKPQTFGEAAPMLKPFVTPSTVVVSIMAGRTIAGIAAVCGGAVVRSMPNTPAAIGRGMTVAVAAKNVTAPQRALADSLLAATGAIEWVEDESLIDAVTAVSGSGPAYVFLLAEELAKAGVAAGPAAGARREARARKPFQAPASCCIVPATIRPCCARTSPRPAAPPPPRSMC